MGLFPPGLGKYSAPQGPTGCAPGALYWSILLIMGVRKPTVASPRCHQKPPGAYKPNSRQQHYNPPILDSTQFPQLGRTTNNPHPTLSYPIHIPPIPHDAMIQRQSSTKNLRGGFMKTERTLTRACRIAKYPTAGRVLCQPKPGRLRPTS